MSNNLKRAIKYNRVKGYWYLEGSNHSEYRQLQNGERLTTTRGSVQYFSNGTKKYLAKPKPNINVVINNLWKFENAQNNGFNGSSRISGAWIFRKVLNLQHENCRCNMDVPSRGLERTVRDSPVRTN